MKEYCSAILSKRPATWSKYVGICKRALTSVDDLWRCTYRLLPDVLDSKVVLIILFGWLFEFLCTARGHVSAPTWRVRLIDEQRNEDSRRIVRPCSHLLSVSIVRLRILRMLRMLKVVKVLSHFLHPGSFQSYFHCSKVIIFSISQNKIKFSLILFKKRKWSKSQPWN